MQYDKEKVVTKKIDIAGLNIDPIRKVDLLAAIDGRVMKREKTFVITPYSEFLYASMRSPELRRLFNSADFAVADGVGVLWAHLFLSKPLTFRYFYLNVLQAWLQVVVTGAAILLKPDLLYKVIPEKIVGADLLWDLAELAEARGFRIYLLGARKNTAELTAQKLRKKFPNVKIVGTSNKDMADSSIIDDINTARPDMLFVAFKAQAAEQWIADNLSKITAALAIGLGGTFDYVAGVKKQPPQFIRRIGLEWLYRFITQPSRIVRIYRGVIGLIMALVRYKVYMSVPFRANAAAVVVNKDGNILLCKRVPGPEKNSGYHFKHFDNYWQFPQGGIDSNEHFTQAARRELMEETGISSVKLIREVVFVNRYFWNNARRSLFTTARFRFKGQEQYTAIFLFEGLDEEIKLDRNELVDYKWVHQDDVLKVIAPERRTHAEAVLAELKQIKL